MNYIIDTNVFQKLFGYYKNKTNSDKIIDVEKLYNNLLENKTNTVNIPIFCVYEILTKKIYRNKVNEIYKFLYEKNIKILNLNKGNIKQIRVGPDDFKNLDNEKNFQYCITEKIKFEQKEVKEYLGYIQFVFKYLIVDTIQLQLKDFNKTAKNLINRVEELFSDNKDNIDKLVNKHLRIAFVNGYQKDKASESVKEFVYAFVKKMIDETFNILEKENQLIAKIILNERNKLYKCTTPLEYIKQSVIKIEKIININYLENINSKYRGELFKLGYSEAFVNYLIILMNRMIHTAKFRKNDTTDNLLLLFYDSSYHLITFDNSLREYLS